MDHTFYSDGDTNAIDLHTKAQLIRSDLITAICYFSHRFQEFFHNVISSKCAHNHSHRLLFRLKVTTRGSFCTHWFAYLKDAPQYGEVSNTEIAKYVMK